MNKLIGEEKRAPVIARHAHPRIFKDLPDDSNDPYRRKSCQFLINANLPHRTQLKSRNIYGRQIGRPTQTITQKLTQIYVRFTNSYGMARRKHA